MRLGGVENRVAALESFAAELAMYAERLAAHAHALLARGPRNADLRETLLEGYSVPVGSGAWQV